MAAPHADRTISVCRRKGGVGMRQRSAVTLQREVRPGAPLRDTLDVAKAADPRILESRSESEYPPSRGRIVVSTGTKLDRRDSRATGYLHLE